MLGSRSVRGVELVLDVIFSVITRVRTLTSLVVPSSKRIWFPQQSHDGFLVHRNNCKRLQLDMFGFVPKRNSKRCVGSGSVWAIFPIFRIGLQWKQC